ncbi:NAD(P)/FAD-dependent oxidoreductase [Aeromicrobium phragmitis]|uniref:NAD(P)/FAD-dependent oxidoreductase n=1 Tax=Aeromicrobium phragmitis TaxID=2478914 RepID=A0A3L8PP09_9ACTN|nr:NAD(P)/FAD-dependent oxidoreductase [Aeromicrobium phragmitis]RLV56168.1 NAD(P)/FAD-dependent oxidoreductase [Aeromicrobium phragmitis]
MTSIGIIGTGFGGIAVAIELLQHGHEDVRLWERADDIGGVWRENTYPGAACDVPASLYSYSFAPHDGWTRRYPSQGEIHAYLRGVAQRYGVTERCRFDRQVTAARWDDGWTVEFADGTSEHVDVLVSAVGQLSEPQVPELPGLDEFDGPVFHSAQWAHDVDLSGRRVAVIGSGATAVQVVPRLAGVARDVVVVQRTPNYILPKPDGRFPRWYRRHAPRERDPIDWVTQQFSRGLDPRSGMARFLHALALGHLRARVRDPELRRALTPRYPIGCKRILFSNDYYPALNRDDVHLVTAPLVAVSPTGIETADGVTCEVDALCFTTGFAAQDFLATLDVHGPAGRLHDLWKDGARAHLGVHVPGFPNFFVSYGPNTNLGGGSIIAMLEAQARHIRQVLDHRAARGAHAVEVRPDAEERWDDEVQDALERSAWASCSSWYRHPISGRITSNWPGGTRGYEQKVAAVRPEEFRWM